MGTELFNVTDVLHDSFSEMENFLFFFTDNDPLDLVWHVQLCDLLWSYLNHFYFLILIERVCITFEERVLNTDLI